MSFLSFGVGYSLCSFLCNNVSIIDSGKNDYEITVKEALHIKFKKATINRQLFTQASSFVLNVF